MKDLIVVAFQGKHRASEVLEQLQGLNDEWTIALDDAVAVYRTDDGKLRVDQSVEPTGKEGGIWAGCSEACSARSSPPRSPPASAPRWPRRLSAREP
jgi:hypothetical protein